jgi:hypothetical protein
VLERLAIAAVEARESFDTAGEDRTAARDRVCSSWIWLECGGAHRGSIPGLGPHSALSEREEDTGMVRGVV